MNKHNVDFRPYVVADFEAVADLWTRVNRELAPAGMETLFEQYIATTIAGELSRLLDIFSRARRNAFWVVELADGSLSLLDAGSCPNDCSGLWSAGRRHTLPFGLKGQDTFGLPAGLGQPR